MNPLTLCMDDWVWSYSRIKLWQQCPHAFIMKYVFKELGESNFYADYGSFIHHILQMYYEGTLARRDLQSYFISNFHRFISSEISAKYKAQYFEHGLDYFGGDILSPTSILGVEKRLIGNVNDFQFTGFIDLLYEDGGRVICDHKSRQLMPRSTGRRKRKDAELDDYLTQLYLYAYLLRQETGIPADYVEFNCFRNGLIIREPCTLEKEEEAAQWAYDSIVHILNSDEFQPKPDYFFCKNLCDQRESCPYAHCV